MEVNMRERKSNNTRKVKKILVIISLIYILIFASSIFIDSKTKKIASIKENEKKAEYQEEYDPNSRI